ncbi:MAG: HU family DNA-binding protein [Planctomycetaceae bacterium]|nr:HU family DNA-binding protein [Planctomycetaceae bacterium]
MAKKAAAAARAMSKSQLIAALAERTELGKKEVTSVLDSLEALVGESISKKGPGQFVLPGLLKIVVKDKKATPAKKGINPRTGETITIKAKPASKVVRVRALKKLKEMV